MFYLQMHLMSCGISTCLYIGMSLQDMVSGSGKCFLTPQSDLDIIQAAMKNNEEREYWRAKQAEGLASWASWVSGKDKDDTGGSRGGGLSKPLDGKASADRSDSRDADSRSLRIPPFAAKPAGGAATSCPCCIAANRRQAQLSSTSLVVDTSKLYHKATPVSVGEGGGQPGESDGTAVSVSLSASKGEGEEVAPSFCSTHASSSSAVSVPHLHRVNTHAVCYMSHGMASTAPGSRGHGSADSARSPLLDTLWMR